MKKFLILSLCSCCLFAEDAQPQGPQIPYGPNVPGGPAAPAGPTTIQGPQGPTSGYLGPSGGIK